jgi:GTP-binding protein
MPQVVAAEFLLGSKSGLSAPVFHTKDEVLLREIAVIGRSNSGKSSLVNKLTGRRKLARTSSTPGRTREFNYFRVNLSDLPGKEELILVDLPGYGYAKFSKGEREKLGRDTVEYLSMRETLSLVCLTCDVRRKRELEEKSLIELLQKRNVQCLLILTKADKLKSNERRSILKKKIEEFSLPQENLILSGTDSKPTELWSRMLELMN